MKLRNPKDHSSFRLTPVAKALLRALALHNGVSLSGMLEICIRDRARAERLLLPSRHEHPQTSPWPSEAAEAPGSP